MVAPISTVWTDSWNGWHILISSLAGTTAGMTISKYLSKIVKAMPPLPANSGWFTQWIYAALKAVTEAEPGTAAK